MRNFPVQTALTIVLLGAAFAGARLAKPHPAAAPPVTGPLPAPVHTVKPVADPLLDDASGVLDGFYQSLERTDTKQPDAITRIVHYGDSPTTADLITGDVRSTLQARFGDSGHGFILPAKPWAWYQHSGANVEGTGWQMAPASRFESRDGLFGFGGVSFTGSGTSRIQFKTPQTSFELWFLRQPNGGQVIVSADGAELGRVETAGEKEPGFATFAPTQPARTLELRTQGQARIYGIAAERPGPGLVYDSLGLNGASVTVLSRMYNPQHWASELQHRKPDLVIVNYGTNEADFAAFVHKDYEKELREALRRLRSALPATSILVMSPMDRAKKEAGGEIQTMDTIPEIVAIQRRVAHDTGCGFFDTFRAMGGAGTMARWYAAKPRLVSADFIHPYPDGGKLVAAAFTREILAGLERYRRAVR